MRIVKAIAKNFGSFKELEFDFESGLILVHGPTGAGKSTICDLIPWVLFGTTSKNGSVDEIRNWSSNGPTEGEVYIEANNHCYTIKRSRKPNDLYFTLLGESVGPERGKDLNDTQKLIHSILNMTAETYLSSAYFHEFSQTAQFFSTAAKNRRALCEQIADLGMAKKIQTSLLLCKKDAQQSLEKSSRQLDKALSNVGMYYNQVVTLERSAASWKPTKHSPKELALMSRKVGITAEIKERSEMILVYQRDIRELKNEKCETCGGPKSSEKLFKMQDALSRCTQVVNGLKHDLIKIQGLEAVSTENPYINVLEDARVKHASEEIIAKKCAAVFDTATKELADLELLSEVLDNFRSQIIATNIESLETNTNDILTNYFDAEINVSFSATIADKVEVGIQKDGNLASYTQLSKGQRCMLKLAFGVAVMRQVANQSGNTPNCVFFDESLDGLSDVLKIKSLSLFRQLATEYEGVYIVDHSEGLKGMVENKIEVIMTSEGSKIGKA